MPKYISRVQFDQMKVFKKRKSTNKDIAKAIGISPSTVSRNLKYNSYEDYLIAMHLNSSKSQQEIESKSGPVKVVGRVKTCTKCGKTKKLEEDFNNDELKVNEAVYVYDRGKVKCGIIRSINNTCLDTYYIVAIKHWFRHKLIKVSSYSVFRMED